jgi:hypothetical protein
MAFGRKKQPKKPEFSPEEYKDEVIDEGDLYEPEETLEPPKPKKKPVAIQEPQPQQRWVVHDSPTEYQRVIVDTETRKPYDLYSAVVEVLNKLEEIRSLAEE